MFPIFLSSAHKEHGSVRRGKQIVQPTPVVRNDAAVAAGMKLDLLDSVDVNSKPICASAKYRTGSGRATEGFGQKLTCAVR